MNYIFFALGISAGFRFDFLYINLLIQPTSEISVANIYSYFGPFIFKILSIVSIESCLFVVKSTFSYAQLLVAA